VRECGSGLLPHSRFFASGGAPPGMRVPDGGQDWGERSRPSASDLNRGYNGTQSACADTTRGSIFGPSIRSPSPAQCAGEGRGGGRPARAPYHPPRTIIASPRPALPHSRTLALSHSRTLALSHSRTLALSHSRTLALSVQCPLQTTRDRHSGETGGRRTLRGAFHQLIAIKTLSAGADSGRGGNAHCLAMGRSCRPPFAPSVKDPLP
jgi:hypothetical protein